MIRYCEPTNLLMLLISYQIFILPVIVISLSLLAAFIFDKIYFGFLKKNSVVMSGNPTTFNFIGHFIKAIIFLVGFGIAIYMIPSLRAIAASLLAGAGILAVAVGFASQQALSNIVSGIFIVIFKPFQVNDRITIRDTMTGVVEDITLRHTVIRNLENRRIVIPNSILSNEILINADFQDTKICRFVDVGISYESDLNLAKKIIFEEIKNHPNYMDNRSAEDIEKGIPEVIVRMIGLGDSSVNLRGWLWSQDTPTSFVSYCDIMESIKKRFDAEGIEIPYPHRTIVNKK
jgi:small conductance mechanosensitive channel